MGVSTTRRRSIELRRVEHVDTFALNLLGPVELVLVLDETGLLLDDPTNKVSRASQVVLVSVLLDDIDHVGLDGDEDGIRKSVRPLDALLPTDIHCFGATANNVSRCPEGIQEHVRLGLNMALDRCDIEFILGGIEEQAVDHGRPIGEARSDGRRS